MQLRSRVEIVPLDLANDAVCGDVLRIWRAAYTLEAQWLAQRDFPPLRHDAASLRASGWQFRGARLFDQWLGVLATEDLRPGGDLWVAGLVVDPVHHGQGVAHALLADLVTRTDAQRICTQTAVANAAARTVYGRMGFLWYRPFVVAAESTNGESTLSMVELRWHRRQLAVDAPVSVRRLRADEGQLLRALRVRALRSDGVALGGDFAAEALRSDAEWSASARELAESVDEAFFVAEVGGRVCGCVHAARDGARLSVWWVDPSQRGKGVGRLLRATAAEWSASPASS